MIAMLMCIDGKSLNIPCEISIICRVGFSGLSPERQSLIPSYSNL